MLPRIYSCLRCNASKKLKECPGCGFIQLCPEHFEALKKYCCNFCKRFQTFLFPYKIADLDYTDGYNVFKICEFADEISTFFAQEKTVEICQKALIQGIGKYELKIRFCLIRALIYTDRLDEAKIFYNEEIRRNRTHFGASIGQMSH